MNDTNLYSLSVIIPTYNETDRLFEAIKSLSKQTYPKKLVEILVVDDGSTELIDQKALIRYATPFKLSLFRNKYNQGRASSRNAGLRNASGEIIIFLDSDMTVLPNFFSSHVQMHKIKNNCVAIRKSLLLSPSRKLKRKMSFNIGCFSTTMGRDLKP